MKNAILQRSGAKILVDQLLVHKVNSIFCVPGESYLSILNVLYDLQNKIALYVCRQEGGAAYMAEAYSKSSGNPGVCFVTRGPGATNASVGLHTAYQDSTALVLFIGQVQSDFIGREAFQEIDYMKMFEPITKWVCQIQDVNRIPELVHRAFKIATSDRPGPVAVSLPEDILSNLTKERNYSKFSSISPSISQHKVNIFQKMLDLSKKPIIILGGGGWTNNANLKAEKVLKNWGIPVISAFRRQHLYNNYLSNYCGFLGLGSDEKIKDKINQSDLIICIGSRLGEITTSSYSILKTSKRDQKLVHIHNSSDEIGIIFETSLSILSGMHEFFSSVENIKITNKKKWNNWTRVLRRSFLKFSKNRLVHKKIKYVDPFLVINTVKEVFSKDIIISNGAGNYTGWIQKYWKYRFFRSQVAPISGSMGYGVPAAIAAKIVNPEKDVLSFSGDGCFMMNSQELATAQQYKLKIIYLIFNNSSFGTIRMHQEKLFPKRVIGTSLKNPDFSALANAYGLKSFTVYKNDMILNSLKKAYKSKDSVLIEFKIDQNLLSTSKFLN